MAELDDDLILKVTDLKKYYPIQKGIFRKTVGHVRAVDGVSLYLRKGETLGLVGESGCGKTTTARLILRAIEPTAGEILFRTSSGKVVNITETHGAELKALRKDIQMMFQDPYGSLNPRMPILDIISEPLRAFGYTRKECETRVIELMELVGLDPGYIRRYPHAFSGGQRQRISFARALALNPSLVVLDEPVSALDVSIQAQILNMLQEQQQRLGLTYLFIAHDLAVIRHICDRVAVMYMGKIVELGETDDVYFHPRHPYTSGLLSAVPDVNPDQPWLNNGILEGEVVSTLGEIAGCAFAPRCKYRENVCDQVPELRGIWEANGSRLVACHLAEKLRLSGVA